MSIEIIIPVLCAAVAAAITLLAAWRWQGDRYLCDTCRFNDPESCLKVERPQAIICKAYRSVDERH